MSPGRLITVEGLDGAGKTTLAEGLAGELAARIRALVKDPKLSIAPRTEALLYAAARAQLVEERLEPLLSHGVIVLLDRFVDSSLAYQGAGRALGMQDVRAINLFATGALVPDRTLLLRIGPDAGRARANQRALEPDRLEQEGDDFFARIAAAYDELARAEPDRIRVIDATQPAAQVLCEALEAVQDLLVLFNSRD